MNDPQFERLLYEEESAALDFKEKQYRFVKASEDDKSELLKDILGFANTWRRSEAFILIGVRDVRGGRADVVGIPAADHLDDHSLQQFVNNLTNRPVRFHYEAFGFEGKQVGVIRIEQQIQPIYLTKDYGKLKRHEVYVRRGSSTDPTKPAGPDELAQMGRGSGPQTAELTVEFAEHSRDISLGTQIAWSNEHCQMPRDSSIPDLAAPDRHWLELPLPASLNRLNTDFFRELAEYEFARRLFRPIRLCMRNIGQVTAANVRIELAVPQATGAMLLEDADMPDPPERRIDPLRHVSAPNFRSILRRTPGELSLERDGDHVRLAIDGADLQPGRKVFSDIFFIGTASTGTVALNGKAFADNLPTPKDISLSIDITVEQTQLSVEKLVELSRSVDV